LNGFNRASTVARARDYAVRGGIIDLFAPGMGDPVRLDFFGDTLESIRSFDPETQRTNADLRALNLVPMAEFQLTSDTIRLFRTGYVAAFGAAAPDDVLYEAVSEVAATPAWNIGCRCPPTLETLFDYLGATPIAIEPLAEEAAHERLAQIADYYQRARRHSIKPERERPTTAARTTLSRRNRMARAPGECRACAADAVRAPESADTIESPPAPATIFPPSAASPTRMCSRR